MMSILSPKNAKEALLEYEITTSWPAILRDTR